MTSEQDVNVRVEIAADPDPALFEGPEMAIFCVDKQSFHAIPEGLPTFERFPG